MAQAPVKPTTQVSKPNPLHGEPAREGTPMPGTLDPNLIWLLCRSSQKRLLPTRPETER